MTKSWFPLPNIGMLVKITTGHSIFSFMDDFSGYNQFKMDSLDVKKTAFQAPMGNFRYTIMPFA